MSGHPSPEAAAQARLGAPAGCSGAAAAWPPRRRSRTHGAPVRKERGRGQGREGGKNTRGGEEPASLLLPRSPCGGRIRRQRLPGRRDTVTLGPAGRWRRLPLRSARCRSDGGGGAARRAGALPAPSPSSSRPGRASGGRGNTLPGRRPSRAGCRAEGGCRAPPAGRPGRAGGGERQRGGLRGRKRPRPAEHSCQKCPPAGLQRSEEEAAPCVITIQTSASVSSHHENLSARHGCFLPCRESRLS
ncbi:uncharacterized protein LJ206_001616 isoform 1-T4 [Theristicus caerulescens]